MVDLKLKESWNSKKVMGGARRKYFFCLKGLCVFFLQFAPYQFRIAPNILTQNVHFVINDLKILPSKYSYP